MADRAGLSDPPATVTDDDRKLAREFFSGFYDPPNQWWFDSLADLIASVRHQRDGEIRELVDVLGTMVEPLRYWAGYDGLCDRAAAIVKRHREGGR